MMIQRSTLTADELAIYLGISRHHVYQLAKSGELPSIRLGRRVLFKKDSVDRFMAERETSSVATKLKN